MDVDRVVDGYEASVGEQAREDTQPLWEENQSQERYGD